VVVTAAIMLAIMLAMLVVVWMSVDRYLSRLLMNGWGLIDCTYGMKKRKKRKKRRVEAGKKTPSSK
jgi:hypothetical protein